MEYTVKEVKGKDLKLKDIILLVSELGHVEECELGHDEIKSVLGMKLSKPMSCTVNDLNDDAIRAMAKAWGEALIERKKTKKS